MTYRMYVGDLVQVTKNKSYSILHADIPASDYRTPVTVCAAKCGRWFRMVTVDHRDGLCHFCWRELFEGEPDIPLEE